MIITCISCGKKFNVNSELIPSSGRTIQCGSCNHVWFYNPKKKEDAFNNQAKLRDKENISIETNIKSIKTKKKTNKKEDFKSKVDIKKRNYELTKYNEKTKFTLTKLLSYIIVSIVSFVALLIVLDTFKSPLYKVFPNLEIFLFSLFELLKDIELFIKDLF